VVCDGRAVPSEDFALKRDVLWALAAVHDPAPFVALDAQLLLPELVDLAVELADLVAGDELGLRQGDREAVGDDALQVLDPGAGAQALQQALLHIIEVIAGDGLDEADVLADEGA